MDALRLPSQMALNRTNRSLNRNRSEAVNNLRNRQITARRSRKMSKGFSRNQFVQSFSVTAAEASERRAPDLRKSNKRGRADLEICAPPAFTDRLPRISV